MTECGHAVALSVRSDTLLLILDEGKGQILSIAGSLAPTVVASREGTRRNARSSGVFPPDVSHIPVLGLPG